MGNESEYKEYLLYSTLLSEKNGKQKSLTDTQKNQILKACSDLQTDENEAICLLIYEHYRRIDGKGFNYDAVLEDIKYEKQDKNTKIDFDSLEPELQTVIYRFLFSS